MTRQNLFDTMQIKDSIVDNNGKVLIANVNAVLKAKTDMMVANKQRYAAIAAHFPNPGLKWWIVALIHEMECSQNFNRYLGNGQKLDQKTTIVPIGRGPFKSFEDGAYDALKLDEIDKIQDWSLDNVLYVLEGFNGYGYSKYHSINSPYIWSGSNHYVSGKYTSDGKYDKNTVSQQIGIALMLREIIDK
jgi:lysozyme family protein